MVHKAYLNSKDGDREIDSFYEFARLVDEIQPKVFIYENVQGLIKHDKGRTWQVVQRVFDSLGYKIHSQVLDAVNYGLPQKRRRIFVVWI